MADLVGEGGDDAADVASGPVFRAINKASTISAHPIQQQDDPGRREGRVQEVRIVTLAPITIFVERALDWVMRRKGELEQIRQISGALETLNAVASFA